MHYNTCTDFHSLDMELQPRDLTAAAVVARHPGPKQLSLFSHVTCLYFRVRYTGPVSSPLPSLEALPQDTLTINNLVQDMKTNIQTMKKYTYDYDDEGQGSAVSGGTYQGVKHGVVCVGSRLSPLWSQVGSHVGLGAVFADSLTPLLHFSGF